MHLRLVKVEHCSEELQRRAVLLSHASWPPLHMLQIRLLRTHEYENAAQQGYHLHTKQALPTLARLIQINDEEVLTYACLALSYLSDGANEKIQEVIQAGVCRRLVELLL